MVLPTCIKKDIRIVSNMGAANPLGGARAARKEAAELGLGDVAVAVVLGDDVSSLVQHKGELRLIENGEPLESILPKMISANAYLGADVVCEALDTGAPIVLSGRVADPSLFLAPMMHEFGWAYDDLPKIAQGTAAGHLLECTASVTGGCFGWPGKKDVPDLARNGYPFADVEGRRLDHDRQDAGYRRPARRHDLHRAVDLRDPRSRPPTSRPTACSTSPAFG